MAAVFVLSLLLLPLTIAWDRYQKQLDDRQFIIEAEEEAAALTQQFRANCQVHTKMQEAILNARSQLEKAADPFVDDGKLVRRTLCENLPDGWISEDALYYAFRFSQSGGTAEQTRVNNRLASLFGERVNGEMFLYNRTGRNIDVIFNGESRTIYWDFIVAAGQPAGAFMIISSSKPSPESAAELALEEVVRTSGNRFFPVMLPIESLTDRLKPLIPVSYRSETPVLTFFSLFGEKTRTSTIASLSAGILYDRTFLFRSTLPRTLPYELWITSEKPEELRTRISSVYPILLTVLWLILGLFRLQRSRPFYLSVRTRLLGLVLTVGGFPLLLLIFAGQSVIDQNHHVRYRAMVDRLHAELREIDGNSTSLRMIFETIARRHLADSLFKTAIVSGSASEDSDVIRRCFADFARHGVAVEAIGITYFGSEDRMLFAPDSGSRRDQSKLYFFSPMMYAGLKNFSTEYHKYARQKSFLISFGDSGHFVVYDFIAGNKKIVAAVTFFALANRAYAGFARNSLIHGARAHPERSWALAELREGNIGLVAPKARRRHAHESTFLEQLTASLRTSSSRIETIGNTLAVCSPCQHMQGFALGVTASLEPLLAQTTHYRRILLVAALTLSAILVMVASALISFFLRPLHIIETGIGNILERRFDFRLNLGRDDELGDVADAFDVMAQGLYERNELAQFVSGALSSQLETSVQFEQKPRKRWGVVLASDIRNFTTLSETYPPEEIVALLNQHLELMSSRITANHGEIDKFIGDAIIAVFFADTREGAARNAVNAAIGMMEEHRGFISKRNEDGRFSYGMGIGIACGEMLIGSYGVGERHEYSLTGRARHQSEELEAESKSGRFSHIVVSPEIRAILPDLALAPLGAQGNFEVVIA